MSFGTKKPVVVCARCAAPDIAGEVWSTPLCFRCHHEWHANDEFGVESINNHLGLSSRTEDFTRANHERYCAEATRRTHAWAKAGRKAAA